MCITNSGVTAVERNTDFITGLYPAAIHFECRVAGKDTDDPGAIGDEFCITAQLIAVKRRTGVNCQFMAWKISSAAAFVAANDSGISASTLIAVASREGVNVLTLVMGVINL